MSNLVALPRIYRDQTGKVDFSVPEALRLIKAGLGVSPNKDADLAVRKLFDKLDPFSKAALLCDQGMTSTFFAKTAENRPFGDRIVTSLGEESEKAEYKKQLITVVPPELRAQRNCGFAINLLAGNFDLEESGDGKTITITFNPGNSELKVLEGVLHIDSLGHAGDSTLWIPINKKTEGSEERFAYTGPESYAHLVTRSHWDAYRVQGVDAHCYGADVFKLFVTDVVPLAGSS